MVLAWDVAMLWGVPLLGVQPAASRASFLGNEAEKERGDAVAWEVVQDQCIWDDAFGDEFIVRGHDVPGEHSP